MKFVVKDHSVRPDEQMVEVLDDYGVLVAAIYPHASGLHIASKYMGGAVLDQTAVVPSMIIALEAHEIKR